MPSDADKLSTGLFREFNQRLDETWIVRLAKKKYTVREISDILEIPRSTVFRKLNEAKKVDYVKRFMET